MEWSHFISILFEEAGPYLEIRGDIQHVRVSHRYALLLLEREGGRKEIIEPAVILHDVGWSCLSPEKIRRAFGVRAKGEEAAVLNRIHEREGAAIARLLLEKHHYPPALTEIITFIIDRHDSTSEASSLEEAIVKDSDKLWRFSTEGFWYEAERQELEPQELHRYLSGRCTSWFFTRSAPRIAREELKQRAKEMSLGGKKGSSPAAS